MDRLIEFLFPDRLPLSWLLFRSNVRTLPSSVLSRVYDPNYKDGEVVHPIGCLARSVQHRDPHHILSFFSGISHPTCHFILLGEPTV